MLRILLRIVTGCDGNDRIAPAVAARTTSVEFIRSKQDPWTLDALREGLALFDRERSASPARVVAVAKDKPGAVGELLAVHFPASEVQLLTAKPLDQPARRRVPPRVVADTFAHIDDLILRVVEHPSPQLMIDAIRRPGAAGIERFRELTFALADGGAFLTIDGAHPGDEASLAAEVARLMSLTGRAASADEWLDRRLQKIIANVASKGQALLVEKSGRHYLNLREDDTTAVLTRRYGTAWGRELLVRPPESFRSKLDVSVNVSRLKEWFPDVLHVPAMYVREYEDVVCAPRQLVVSGDFVIPASFHHPSAQRPRNHKIRSASKYFAEARANLDTAEPLEGTFFHLDSEYPHLFGHVFSEDIAKLWGWDIAKQRYPQLRVLRSVKGTSPRPASYVVQALGAYGIAEPDIVCIDRPVRVERLVTASQQFHNGKVIYVNERIADTWWRLRDGLRTPDGPRFEKIFVARPDVKRSCLNGADVEAAFARHGFEIVRPELLPLAQQVELFASARVIAGYAGSGMFGMMYCEHPGTRIVIASEKYHARDVFLISAVKGDDLHYFSCPSRLPADPSSHIVKPKHPSRPRSRQGLRYDFEFDFQRDGDALEALLAGT